MTIDPARLSTEQLAQLCDASPEYARLCGLIAQMHALGATLRPIAKLVGMSRSTLHRDLPLILAIASHMGQTRQTTSEDAEKKASGVALVVPDGTDVDMLDGLGCA